MGQDDYEKPSRTIKIGDHGSDVLGFVKAVNRIFKNRDLGRRLPSDNTATNETMKKGALAARMVGVPEDNVEGAEKKDKSHRRLDTRMQDLVRYGDKRSDKQKKNGRVYTDRFLADLAAEEAKNDPDVINQWFRISDYNASDGCKVPSYSEDALRRLVINYHTPLREDSGGALYISSGYRTIPPQGNTNAACGGVTGSWHSYVEHGSSSSPNKGVASDIKSSKWSAQKVQSYLDNMGIDGLGFYAQFTHGDNRGYRSRWNGGY